MNKEITPIFILGSARNGTTLLSNILCQHPEIIGVQHWLHWGIKESNILKNYLYWEDLCDIDNYIEFIEMFSASDFFQLTKVEKEYFYRTKFENFFIFFLELMDKYAINNEKQYWVTKLDPLFYYNSKYLEIFQNYLKKRYKKVFYIGIKRDYINVLKSYIKMQGRASQNRGNICIRPIASLLEISRYIVHYEFIERFIDTSEGILLDFHKLIKNRKEILGEVLEYLNLEFSESMLLDKYLPNSSYFGREVQKPVFSKVEQIIIQSLVFPVLSKSKNICKFILLLRDKIRGIKSPLFFHILKYDYFIDDFLKELEKQEEVGLLKRIKENSRQ